MISPKKNYQSMGPAEIFSSLSERILGFSVEELSHEGAQIEAETLARGLNLIDRANQVSVAFAQLKNVGSQCHNLSIAQRKDRASQWNSLKSEVVSIEHGIRLFSTAKKSLLPNFIQSFISLRINVEEAATNALEELEFTTSEMPNPAFAGKSMAEKTKKKLERAARLEKRAGLLKELQQQMQEAKNSSEGSSNFQESFQTARARAAQNEQGTLLWASEVLGVSRADSRAVVRARYLERARQWHPDVRGTKEDADEAMVWLNEAWDILKRNE